MSPKRTSARTNRAAVSWFGRLKTVGHVDGISVAMRFPRLAHADGPRREVVPVGTGHAGPHEVARPQVLSLEPDDAVNLRSVKVPPGEVMARHLGVWRVDNQLRLRADSLPCPGEGDLLLDRHQPVPALRLAFLGQVVRQAV